MRDGKKSESSVTGTLAMAAAIPAAIAGVFLGWWLTPDRAGAGQLLLTVAGVAFGLSSLVIVVILAMHRWFGQRGVARMAICLIGIFTGFLLGLTINSIVEPGPWPFVVPLAGAVVGILMPIARPPGEVGQDETLKA